MLYTIYKTNDKEEIYLKRLKLRRVFFCIVLLCAIIYGLLEFNNYFMPRNFSKGSGNASTSINTVNKSYSVIKEDINTNYGGKRTRKS